MRLRVPALFATTTAALFVVGAVPAVSAGAAPTAPTAPTGPAGAPADTLPDTSATGTYYPNAPRRVLDTRSGGARVGQGRAVRVAITANGVTPSAAVLNLTVVDPTTSGYLTAYPSGTARPRTSSINFAARGTVANLVTVPVGRIGNGYFVDVYNGLGTTDVVVDQVGVYSLDDAALATRGRGGGYQPAEPQRLLDSRSIPNGALPPNQYGLVGVRYNGDGGHIAALAVNITVTNTSGSGYVTAWDGSSNVVPRASTLNFTRGRTVANSAVVPASYCQVTESGRQCSSYARIGIFNGSSGDTDVVVDITGYFDDGNLAAPVRFFPLSSPVRIVDSRSRLGTGKLGPMSTQAFAPPANLSDANTVGLDANVTAVAPTASTYLTLWPAFTDLPKPATSTVNAGKGQVVSNHAIQEVGDGRRVNVLNFNGVTDLVVDVSGTFRFTAGGDGKRAGATPRAAGVTSPGWPVHRR